MATVLRWLAAAAATGVLAAPVAWADRPLVSETADVIDKGTCQVEAFGARQRASGAPSVRGLAAIYSCGIGGTQLAAGLSRESGGGDSSTGLLLGGKTNFTMPEGETTGWGVAYTLVASRASGAGTRVESLSIVGLVTREIADGLLWHGNLGWSRDPPGRRSATVYSMGLERTGDTFFAADVFGDDRGRPSLSVGVGRVLAPSLSINAAQAWSFDRPRARQLSVGLKVVF